jgi:hypothetical protein
MEQYAPAMHQEAQGNSKGDLPSPSREVQGGKEEKSEGDTDMLSFTERGPDDGTELEERKGEEMAHTEETNSKNTRVYVPGDFSQSPLRDVPKTIHTSSSASGTDICPRSAPTAGVTQAWQMAGLIVIWGMLVLAAQYGGASSKTSSRGTLSGDPESPPREVPAPNSSLERILVTDTMSPEMYVQKHWLCPGRRRYTKRENEWCMKLRRTWREKKPEAGTEEELKEDEGEDARWCHWTPPCML